VAATILPVSPPHAVAGARVTIHVTGVGVDGPRLPEVTLCGIAARAVFASRRALIVVVPGDLPAGPAAVRVEGVEGEGRVTIGAPFATGLHQVDNPVFHQDGCLYVTDSGWRGEAVKTSIFRVRPDGTREAFASGIVNATSMAFGPDRRLYVSSRFEERVYAVDASGLAVVVGTGLGTACGLAFDREGRLFVGDRSGTILALDLASGRAHRFATLPPSIAAFHLAYGPDDALYVTAPTLAARDHVYRVDREGDVTVVSSAFGRPQGLAFDPHGVLCVVEATAGWNGVDRISADGAVERFVAGVDLVGLAFDPGGGLAVCSNDTVYRF
jgi:sugar lactone lactonase YvrE